MKAVAEGTVIKSKGDGLLAVLFIQLHSRSSSVSNATERQSGEKKSTGASLFPPSSAPAGFWGESERKQE